MPPEGGISWDEVDYFCSFSHCWLAMPQLVLQADWQEVWHSPQPPFFALSQRFLVSRVLIVIVISSKCLDSGLLFIWKMESRKGTAKARRQRSFFFLIKIYKTLDKFLSLWYNNRVKVWFYWRNNKMKRINTIETKNIAKTVENGGCGECQTSCQSACKTSCGVANQQCENKNQK